jgi:hypothetical protein
MKWKEIVEYNTDWETWKEALKLWSRTMIGAGIVVLIMNI